MESRTSLQRCSSLASSHWPLPGSLQSWYTSQLQILDVLAHSQDQEAPWWWVLPPNLILVMASSGPSGWSSCVHSYQLWQHAETSVGKGTHGEGHQVATTSFLGGRHQYPTSVLPLSPKYSLFWPAHLAVVVFAVLLL